MRHKGILLGLLLAALPAWTYAMGEAPTNTWPGGLWFPVGEEIFYEIHWGVVPVGMTHITTSWVTNDSRTLLKIQIVTQTKKKSFMDRVYPVDDYIESLIDPETFLPIHFIKTLREGKYRADETTTFDYTKLIAHWVSKTNGRKKEFAIESTTRDIVTFMYYIRQFGFTPGQTNGYRVMADEKMYDLVLRVEGTDTLKLPQFGPVPTVRLNPVAAFQGIFIHKGEIHAWASQDSRHICTRVMAEVPVANVRLNIIEVRGPGDDFWVKPKNVE